MNRPLILIADDSAGFRSFVRKALEPAGYSVLEMGVSASVEKLVRERRPHLVLLDSVFGGAPHGPEILERLKTDPATKSIPVVVLAGSRDQNRFARWIELGAKGCLSKSVEPVVFVAKVRSWLGAAAPPQTAGSDLPLGNVLHVEDDEQWSELVRCWLEAEGYVVNSTPDGGSALARLTECAVLPDCIILDIHLEGGSGLDLCAALKGSPSFQRIPVIVFSNHPGDKIASLQRSAVCFIPKSHKPAELLSTVRATIRQQEWAAGVIEDGDLRLDPRDCAVYQNRKLIATIEKPLFQLFYNLVLRSPSILPDHILRSLSAVELGKLKGGLCEHTRTVDVYVSRLRQRLGPVLGARVQRFRKVGFFYKRPDTPAPCPDRLPRLPS